MLGALKQAAHLAALRVLALALHLVLPQQEVAHPLLRLLLPLHQPAQPLPKAFLKPWPPSL